MASGSIQVGENGLVSVGDSEKLMSEIETLRNQLMTVTNERDKLAHDRKQWMARVQNDNQHLAGMLRNVRDAKVRLVEEMDAVQVEKGKYRSLQLQLQNNELKSTMYPLDDEDCVISEARRPLISTQPRQEEAARIHTKLTALVTKVHENVIKLNEIKITKNSLV